MVNKAGTQQGSVEGRSYCDSPTNPPGPGGKSLKARLPSGGLAALVTTVLFSFPGTPEGYVVAPEGSNLSKGSKAGAKSPDP